jgi:DNA-binding SARP family transcriptional activator/tetratricopeptide (TPR) repeat protein
MDASPPCLQIRLLGDFRVEYDGAPVDGLTRPRCQALLAYLLLHREAAQSRHHLAFLLWPDSSEAQALTNLRHVLHDLQAALPRGPSWLAVTSQTLRWNTATPFDLDVAAFGQGAHSDATPAELQTAIDVYRGELLPACYDDWVLPERERLLQAYLSALERLAAIRETEGDYGAAIDLARRLLSRDPLREASYRLLMRLHTLNGDRSAALHVYHSCASVLQEELGVTPDPSTRRQYEQLMDLEALAAAQLPSFLEIIAEESAPVEPRRPVFVARERELARLDGFLHLALGGQCRIVFVTGDPGQGKTALVQEFARRAQAAHPELVVAGGNGNAYTGKGDPYVPFREILSLLTGDIEEQWAAQSFSREQARRLWHTLPLTAQALVEAGPDLVDTFVSGPPLAQRAAAYAPWPGRADWLPRLQQLVQRKASFPPRPDLYQNALFEQYSRVLRAIARRRPLLLTLDDLQWADGGSISLLFHLGRSMAGSRVLLVGAYRPADIALGRAGERHPLEPVVNESKLQWGEIEVDLREADGERFVAAFLDTEPNRLGEAFRRTLFQHTAGLPLATVELLREMQARGGLIRDESDRWIVGPTLDWSTLPARVEAMIADRIARLDERARHALQVASVEGETFTAEVIADVVGVGEQEVVRLLSEELDRRHWLVKAEGIRHLNGRQLSLYRFRHILFQKYLYTGLNPVERARLHDAVGAALESFYAARTDQVVAELARHFAASGATDQAAIFLVQAGDRAGALAAYQEAADYHVAARDAYAVAYGERWDPHEQVVLERKIGEALFRRGDYQGAMDHLQRALGLLGARLPESRAQVQRALLGQIVRQAAHRVVPRIFRQPGNEAVPAAIQQELDISYLVSFIDFFASRQERFLLLAFKILNVAEANADVPWISRSCAALSLVFDFMSLRQLGGYYSRRAVSLAEQVRDAVALAQAHHAAAHHGWLSSEWDRALEHSQRALAVLGEGGALRERSTAVWVIASVQIWCGDLRAALAVSEELVRIGDEKADVETSCVGAGRQGLAQMRLGRLEDARTSLKRAVALADAVPDHLNRVEARGDLGNCLLRLGEWQEAVVVLEEGGRLCREHRVQYHNAVPVLAGLVEAYLRAAEQTEEPAKGRWLEKAAQAAEAALKNARRFRPALAEAMRLRGTVEWLQGNTRSARKWWQRSIGLATQLGMRYDLGMVHLEMGLRLHDRAHLERAETILTEIDSAWDAARAREAREQIGADRR